ncbi:hypothetical protein LTR24_003413 [Lithohypha guttulata]|uniref:Uncharacterized protein n=1 Tax=Lithohypha guttulata TaxID=1690604 RepID=A0ABR0KEU0_9EURO|nr:hypothetical protein LTR24_003413 [Lithohypha guttulata]
MSTNSATNQPLYFPPPPTSVVKDADSKKNLKFNFAKSKPSKETNVTVTSIEEPPEPTLKKRVTSTKRVRQWILLTLLILSFTMIILSTIFAYCAALPHSDNIVAAQAAAASPGATTTTSTISLVSVSASTSTPMLPRDTPQSNSNDPSIEAALAEDASNQQRFSTTSAMAALTFYTATLPFLTMLHTTIELLTSLIRPQTTQHTRLGDALRFRAGADVDARGLVTRRRIGTLLSFSASALLCLGWLTMQMFWINCEIATFGGSPGAEQICPVQIRGHRMGGVSELSVGKVVLGFVVLIGYLGYCVYLVRFVGVFSLGRKGVGLGSGSGGRMTGFRRRARFASASLGTVREVEGERDAERGDAESVVIVIEGGKETK